MTEISGNNIFVEPQVADQGLQVGSQTRLISNCCVEPQVVGAAKMGAENLGQGTGDREVGAGNWDVGGRELEAANWGQGTRKDFPRRELHSKL